jgi:hypothetical protein
VVAYTCNPITLKAEAGGPRVQDQPGLHNEILSQKNKKKTGEVVVKPCLAFTRPWVQSPVLKNKNKNENKPGVLVQVLSACLANVRPWVFL